MALFLSTLTTVVGLLAGRPVRQSANSASGRTGGTFVDRDFLSTLAVACVVSRVSGDPLAVVRIGDRWCHGR